MSKWNVADAWCERACLVLAMTGQWDIRTTGVLAGQRPLGFAMADKVQPKGCTHFRSIVAL
jgi:hypothetical protein